MDVLIFTSIGLEGSRFPKFRAEVDVVNQQNPLDMTDAVTDTELESAAKPMLAAIKIERVTIATVIIFNCKLHLAPLIQPLIRD
ncbi:MAG: hypothetical protein AB1502_07035 [Thermodesulfobacteriota bacterium]